MGNVLVVDDKEMLRDSVGVTLQRAGHTVLAAPGGEAALETIARKRPDAVVTDLKMPGMTGLELLERIKEIDEDLPVILMTAFGTIETAVQAMTVGAYTYLTKPFKGDELIIAVKRAIEHARLKRENEILRRSAPEPPKALEGSDAPAVAPSAGEGLDRLVGDSEGMSSVKEQVDAVAKSQGTVLIQGESGVGKEVVARAIHELSPRSGGPFMALNCAALSSSLLESELFGHEKGAFTGAEKLRKGRFELAHGGTLLLDEISEISPQIQAKLLRVLQERVFERVGSSVSIGVDVRVLATTNRDLTRSVESGEFRQDLFFRLNVLPVCVPPLRERSEDVQSLAEHFVRKVCAREGLPEKRIADSAVQLMRSYQWPGNVRELQNICERAVVLCRGGMIGADLVHPWLHGPAPGRAQPKASTLTPEVHTSATVPPASVLGHGLRPLEEIERQAIIETLERFNGHRQKTAEALGIGVRTLGLKLRKWKDAQIVSEAL